MATRAEGFAEEGDDELVYLGTHSVSAQPDTIPEGEDDEVIYMETRPKPAEHQAEEHQRAQYRPAQHRPAYRGQSFDLGGLDPAEIFRTSTPVSFGKFIPLLPSKEMGRHTPLFLAFRANIEPNGMQSMASNAQRYNNSALECASQAPVDSHDASVHFYRSLAQEQPTRASAPATNLTDPARTPTDGITVSSPVAVHDLTHGFFGTLARSSTKTQRESNAAHANSFVRPARKPRRRRIGDKDRVRSVSTQQTEKKSWYRRQMDKAAAGDEEAADKVTQIRARERNR